MGKNEIEREYNQSRGIEGERKREKEKRFIGFLIT